MDVERMRRMVEVVFGETKTKVTIFTDKNKEIMGNKEVNKNKKQTYALVVNRVPGEQLERTVNRIKESVKHRGEKEQIQSLRTTREGRILMEMGKGEEDARELKEVIERSIITKVTVKGPHKKRDVIHTRGMDVTATRDEVRRALLNRMEGLKDWEFSVGDMRENRANTQAVTVVMDEERVKALMDDPYLRVGYNKCRMEMRVKVGRCYRCWELDHVARDCKGIDRTGCCFVCGEEGHRREECNGRERCYICNMEGHRTGTGKCEAFRKALTAARRERRRSVAVPPPVEGGGA
ncbi:uncharacterized protein [Euwallacea similis]|uniref:uncharacterized protein n=1 Tax=Euwallacea similis TaxID=1736056 RepID=UPI00344B334D